MATKVSFNPLTWVNKVTKRSAENYNRQEEGIDDCAKAVNAVIDDLTLKSYTVGYTGNNYAYADAENDTITVEVINRQVIINGFAKVTVASSASTVIASSNLFKPRKGYIRTTIQTLTSSNGDNIAISVAIGGGQIQAFSPITVGQKIPIHFNYVLDDSVVL